MASGNNNPNQPNSQLPVAVNASIKRLGNLLQLNDGVLLEKDPEYWFHEAIKFKESKEWARLIFACNRATFIDKKHTKSYLVRAYGYCQLGESKKCADDVVLFFTTDFFTNYFNRTHDILTKREWKGLYDFLLNPKLIPANETLSIRIAQYFSGNREIIPAGQIDIDFGQLYIKWGYLMAYLLSTPTTDIITPPVVENENGLSYLALALEVDANFTPAQYLVIQYELTHFSRNRLRFKFNITVRSIASRELENALNILMPFNDDAFQNSEYDHGVSELVLYLKEKKQPITLEIVDFIDEHWHAGMDKLSDYLFIQDIMGTDTPNFLCISIGFEKILSGNYEDGMKDLNIALANMAGRYSDYYRRGIIRLNHGDYIGAIADFNIAIGKYEKYYHGMIKRNLKIRWREGTVYYYARAEARMKNNDFKDALLDINHAIELDPQVEYLNLKKKIESLQ